VSGGLKEARAARAEIVSKLARGEQVAPSKLALADIAETWLETQLHLRRRTRERYETVLRLHVLPHLGRLRVGSITEDDVGALMREMRGKGLSPATIRKTVMVLGRILGHAARRGLIPVNPVARLERGERPAVERPEMRVLERHEIGAVLDAADSTHRPLLATAIFCGLRLGELLGLTWADIDFEAGLIHVRHQLDRDGQRVKPKTPQAVRSVVLMPALARILLEHRLASPFKAEDDPVFASSVGTPLHYRNVSGRGLDVALEQAGLSGGSRPKVRFHDLRHTAASLLIAEGLPVAYVAAQLGHADPSITLKVYAHLFDRAAHAERARSALEDGYGKLLESSGGVRRLLAPVVELREAASLHGVGN
jgi:integrase